VRAIAKNLVGELAGLALDRKPGCWTGLTASSLAFRAADDVLAHSVAEGALRDRSTSVREGLD
jgi:hypothetical protein